MLPSVEIEIYHDNIFLGGESKRPLSVGEKVLLGDNSATFRYENDSLKARIAYSGNAVEFSVSGCTQLERGFYPADIKGNINWNGILGVDPNEPSLVDFNNPDHLLTIRYLGHPARDVLLPLIEKQQKQTDTTGTATLDLYGSGLIRKVISMSSVIETNIVPCARLNPDLDTSGYQAQTLFCMAAKGIQDREPSSLVLFMATIADKDGLMRLYEEEIGNFAFYKLGKFLPRMAEVSLFFRTLKEQKDKVDISGPEKWHPNCFALRIIDALRAYLYDSDSYCDRFFEKDGYGTDIKKRYGFDWRSIKKGFSTQDLRNEQERLRAVAAVL